MNAVANNFLGQGFGEADHSGLGRRVGHQVGIPFFARDRGHVDDLPVALLHHVGKHGLRAQEHALEVNRHHPLPVLFGDVSERRILARNTRVVHQDVHPSHFVKHAADHLRHLRGLRHVTVDGNRSASAGPQSRRHRFSQRQVEVHHDHVGRRLFQAQGDGFADPLSGPRYDRDALG